MSLANVTFNYTPKNESVQNEDCFENDLTAVKMARIVPYCMLLVVSLLGNSAIIAAVWKEQRLRKTVNFFMVNMCTADLLITLYMPRSLSVWHDGYKWQLYGTLGLVVCKFAVFMHQTAICVSIFTVVAISFDRFFAVILPLRTIITKKICRIIITMIWFSSVVIRLPMLYGLKLINTNNGETSCHLSLDDVFYQGAEKTYYNFTLIGLFAVPLAVIVVLYSAILISLKLRKAPGEEIAGREHTRDTRIKKKVLRMVLIVVAAFVLCWLLYFVQLILFSYKIQVGCEVLFFRLFLADLNSAVNPCLCFALNENFRTGLKRILVRCALCSGILSEENTSQRVFPTSTMNLWKTQQNDDEQS